MTILEIAEAHEQSFRTGRCSCEEYGPKRTDKEHNAHVAEVLEKHMQEREARAWSAGFHKGRKSKNGSHISTWPKNPYRTENP